MPVKQQQRKQYQPRTNGRGQQRGPRNGGGQQRQAQKKSNPVNLRSIAMQSTIVPSKASLALEPYFKVREARPKNRKYKGSIGIDGCDYLGTVQLSTTDTVGLNKANYLWNPLSPQFNNTRLQAFARLYEKYIFDKVKVYALPSQSAAVSGSYLMAFDKDVGDNTPPASEDGIRQYSAMQDFKSFQVYQPTEMDSSLTDPQDFYYTNYSGVGDIRLTHQGQFYLSCISPSTQNGPITLWAEYSVDMFDPQLETLSADTKFSTNSPSITVPALGAWNLVLAGTRTGQPVEVVTDGAGNSGLNLRAGNYILEQILTNATNTVSLNVPTFVSNSIGQTMIQTTLDAVSNVAGGTLLRNDNIIIPSGGGKLFGNMSAVPGVNGVQGLRILNWLGSQFV